MHPNKNSGDSGWAFILCAGLGTRLAPLTNDRPKALVSLNGETLLDHTLRVCRRHGFAHFILNVHAHAQVLEEFVAKNLLRSQVMLSREFPDILDTGGGLKKAVHTLIQKRGKIPVEIQRHGLLVHNVDVVHRLDLGQLRQAHTSSRDQLTLVVSERRSSRYLIFKNDLLCGHWNVTSGFVRWVQEGESLQEIADITDPQTLLQRTGAIPKAFSGIYMVGPSCFSDLLPNKKYALVDWLLHLVAKGYKVGIWEHDPQDWMDVGTPERLDEAGKRFGDKTVQADEG